MTTYPSWLLDLLGPPAADIVNLIPTCIRAGHERARDAQDASRLRQRNPYGGTSWLAVYDEFAVELGRLWDASLYKPKNASYSLVIINETLLYPCRVTVPVGGRLEEGRLKPTRLRRAISGLSERVAVQQPLDFAQLLPEYGDEELEPELVIPQSVARRVLLVPFTSNADAGLLTAGVGQGNLLANGSVEWYEFHQLALDLHRAAPQAVVEEYDAPRFDNGTLPEPSLSRRPREVGNPEALDELNASPVVGVENESNV